MKTLEPEFLQQLFQQLNGHPAVLLEFLTLLPEEVRRADLEKKKQMQVYSEMSQSFRLVLLLLEQLMAHSDSFLRQSALRCLQSWIQFEIPVEYVRIGCCFSNEEVVFYATLKIT